LACPAAARRKPARCAPLRPGRRSRSEGRAFVPQDQYRGTIGEKALHPGAVGRILAYRAQLAGLKVEECERLSAHALRVGFITEAYGKGVRDADIMRHTRHRDLRSMRGYVRRAGLLSDSPAGLLDL
jgi:integrase